MHLKSLSSKTRGSYIISTLSSTHSKEEWFTFHGNPTAFQMWRECAFIYYVQQLRGGDVILIRWRNCSLERFPELATQLVNGRDRIQDPSAIFLVPTGLFVLCHPASLKYIFLCSTSCITLLPF